MMFLTPMLEEFGCSGEGFNLRVDFSLAYIASFVKGQHRAKVETNLGSRLWWLFKGVLLFISFLRLLLLCLRWLFKSGENEEAVVLSTQNRHKNTVQS